MQHVASNESNVARCPLCFAPFHRSELRFAAWRLVGSCQVRGGKRSSGSCHLLLSPDSLTLKGVPSSVLQAAQSWKFEQIPRARMALVRLPGGPSPDPAPEDDTGKAKQALPRWAKAMAGPSAARPPLPASVTADKHARCTVIDDALPLFQSEARQIGRQQAQVGRRRTKGLFLWHECCANKFTNLGTHSQPSILPTRSERRVAARQRRSCTICRRQSTLWPTRRPGRPSLRSRCDLEGQLSQGQTAQKAGH